MKEILEELGFNQNEIKIYLSLLKIGETKVGELIKDSKVPSSKIYDIIKRLVQRGLISYKYINKIKFYKASHPSNLKFLLNEKRDDLIRKEEELDVYLKNFSYGNNDDGKVEFFEGIKGVRMAHNILFSKANKDSILKYFFPYEKMSSEQDLFYKKLWLDHAELNLKSRGISVKEVLSDPNYRAVVDHNCMKFVDFPLPGTIDILESYVLIISWTNKPTAVLISSIEIVKHFENYFDSIWNMN